MSEKKPEPGPAPVPAPASFTATPSENARTHQAGRDQTNSEVHHHHGPGSTSSPVSVSVSMAVPPPTAPPVSPAPPTAPPASPAERERSARRGARTPRLLMAVAVVLALVAGAGGAWWWAQGAKTTEVRNGAGVARSSSGPPSAPVSPTVSVSSGPDGSGSAEPAAAPAPASSKSAAVSSPAPSIPSTTPSRSAAVLTAPANPAREEDCRAWASSYAEGVQVRPCFRRVGDDRVYMIVEWRALSAAKRVDVHIWVEDAQRNVVYPDAAHGMAFHGMGAYEPGSTDKPQWEEALIEAELKRGATYEVCVAVYPEGPGDNPNVRNPDMTGTQRYFVH